MSLTYHVCIVSMYTYVCALHSMFNVVDIFPKHKVLLLGFIGDIGFAFGGAEYDQREDPADWKATPILVETVTRGSIAEKAGLEPGDEIVKARVNWINSLHIASARASQIANNDST